MIKSVTTRLKIKKTGREYLESYLEYDVLGNEIFREVFSPENFSSVKTVSAYDSKNRIVRKNVFNSGNSPVEVHKFFYNKSGDISNEEISQEDSIKMIRTYFYTPGSLMKRTINGQEEELERLVINYDGSHNVIEETMTDSSGVLSYHLTQEYDHNNKLSCSCKFDSSGAQIRKVTYTYNSLGLLEREKIEESGRIIPLYNTYKYDGKNREIFRVIGDLGNIETLYDDENHTVTEKRTSEQGILMDTIVAVYDSQGLLLLREDSSELKTLKYEYF